MDTGLRPTQDDTGHRELVAYSHGRVDAVLAAAYPEMSRARLQKLLAEGHVLVNGEPVRKSGRVNAGDSLTLTIPETLHEITPTGLEFDVLYQDEHFLAVDKPAGVPVHGAPGDTAPCVALWFLERFAEAAKAFSVDRPGIVHRLDKDTSGVLLLAKTTAAQTALNAAFEARTVHKTYLAVTDGVPAKPRAVIDAGIARHPGDRTKMAVSRGGREARTTYEVLASDHGRAFIELHPETGRTHQIRVHLAAIGAPVLFDRTYGKDHGPEFAQERAASRQLLHAWRITFPHPATGEEVTITSPVPADLRGAVADLGAGELLARFEI